MSPKFKSLALALAVLGAVPAAEAADWNNGAGGIKDYKAAGVPVPAPIPVMEHFRWYLRADVGLGIYHEVSASEIGTTYGAIQGGIGALNSFGSGPSWFSTDFNTFASYGVGVGLYVTPRVRGDITVDARTESNINGRGTYSYALYNHAVAPVAPIGVTVFGTVSDRTEVRTTAGLMNVYYDLTDRGALTPYVGIGAGFAVRNLKRSNNSQEQFVSAGGTVTSAGLSGHTSANSVAPAVALTAGAAYSLQSGMVLDFNYRYMYVGETDVSLIAGAATSVVKLGDTHEHSIRAGLRWNVW